MLTRRFFLTGITLLAISGWVMPSAQAQGGNIAAGAADFVQNLGNRALETLARVKLTKEQADQRFRDLLHEGFDVPTIGQFALGRYWNQATPPQRQEYLKLFEAMIVQVYADRFRQYSGESFKITGQRPEGNDIFVGTQIIRPSGPPVAVEWRVRHNSGRYQIIDVVVENVSMTVTQRSEFASVIQGGGGQIEALLKALRQKVAAN